MLKELPKPVIFAHRGASAYAPENTLAAFELAIKQGADGIELDAKLTADGYVVVIHDQLLDRTTSGQGKVFETTWSQIQNLDAGSFFDPVFSNQKVPTLERVLETVGGETFTNIELTNYASPFDDLPQKAAEIVMKLGLENRIMFSSFNPIALRKVKRLLPHVPVGLLALPDLAGTLPRSLLGRLLVNYQSLHPEKSNISLPLLAREHRRNCYVFAYTVNEPEEMMTLFQMGTDGIFTDDPPKALEIRASFLGDKSNREGIA